MPNTVLSILPYQDTTLTADERATNLLGHMTLAEKIGQMTQVEKNSMPSEDVTNYFIGSVLSGGGGYPTPNTPKAWADMITAYQKAALQTRLQIPMLYGVDAVHGHNNVVGTVIFPHNIGLGATRDAALIEKIAHITAKEVAATGIYWDFAPTVAVPQDIRWGRTYEGYSDQTELVSELGVAYLRGLQEGGGELGLDDPTTVLASVKHFVADGGTTWGSTQRYEWIIQQWSDADRHWQLDQGVTEIDEETLRTVHLAPYIAAIEAGAKNIMVSYSSWYGSKMHGHSYLLTEVLKKELGFEGFLVSDWMAIDQLAEDFYTCVVNAINAGLDMIMVPFNYKRFIETLTKAVTAGDISQGRIDDAVHRILKVKFELGLFERPFSDPSLLADVGCDEHRAVAREAVRKSAVLLKNDGDVLPLAKETASILVAGEAADDIGLQCGGWTIEWMGKKGNSTPGTTLLAGIQAAVADSSQVHYQADGDFSAQTQKAEVGIVVISEPPYAEGAGDRDDLHLPAEDIALIEKVRPHCEKLVVILLSGRPLIVTEQLASWDAFVAAWLPGTEGNGIADVLFGDYPFTGKLSYNWPRDETQVPKSKLVESKAGPLFPFGYGLT